MKRLIAYLFLIAVPFAASAITVDDLCGKIVGLQLQGYDYVIDNQAVDNTDDCTLVKIDDETVELQGLMGKYNVRMKVRNDSLCVAMQNGAAALGNGAYMYDVAYNWQTSFVRNTATRELRRAIKTIENGILLTGFGNDCLMVAGRPVRSVNMFVYPANAVQRVGGEEIPLMCCHKGGYDFDIYNFQGCGAARDWTQYPREPADGTAVGHGMSENISPLHVKIDTSTGKVTVPRSRLANKVVSQFGLSFDGASQWTVNRASDYYTCGSFYVYDVMGDSGGSAITGTSTFGYFHNPGSDGWAAACGGTYTATYYSIEATIPTWGIGYWQKYSEKEGSKYLYKERMKKFYPMEACTMSLPYRDITIGMENHLERFGIDARWGLYAGGELRVTSGDLADAADVRLLAVPGAISNIGQTQTDPDTGLADAIDITDFVSDYECPDLPSTWGAMGHDQRQTWLKGNIMRSDDDGAVIKYNQLVEPEDFAKLSKTIKPGPYTLFCKLEFAPDKNLAPVYQALAHIGVTTGMEDAISGKDGGEVKARYTPDGRPASEGHRGVTILVHADGSVTRTVVP